MKVKRQGRAVLAVAVIVALSFGTVQAALNWDLPEELYPDCRFGLGVSVNGPIDQYAVDQLGLGWYMDWNARANPRRPNGIHMLQTVTVQQNKTWNGSGWTYFPGTVFTPALNSAANGLGPIVQANPGAVWVIGNEPDRDGPNGVYPSEFAMAYRQAYNFIKGIDPTAKVAMPGLVEVTPLRLKYLDTVSSTYQSLYSAPMPVDVWTGHLYILPEGLSWGAHYPLGIRPTAQTPAMTYTISQHDNLGIFQGQVQSMRSWMAANGYRNTALLWTEFGILYPADYYDELGHTFNAARVNAFMNGVFDFFRGTGDINTGLPADGNRLVQAWAWYSIADTLYNGALFDPATKQLTALGQNFAAYTRALGPDLIVSSASAVPVYAPGGPATGTLTARIQNRGGDNFVGTYTVTFYSDISQTQTIDQAAFSNLDAQATRAAQVTWSSVSPGAHPFYVTVERAASSSTESNTCNNQNQGVFLAAPHQSFMPVVQRLK